MSDDVDPRGVAGGADAGGSGDDVSRHPGDEPRGSGAVGDGSGDGPSDGPGWLATAVKPTFDAIFDPKSCWRVLDDRPVRAVWIFVWVAVAVTALGAYNLPLTEQMLVANARAGFEAPGQVAAEGEEAAAARERVERTAETWGKLFVGLSPVFVLAQLLIFAGILWAGAAMTGSTASFGRSFGVVAAAAVVYPVLYTVYATVVLSNDPPEIRGPEDAVHLQPSAGLDLLFGAADLPAWADALLKQVSLFNVWWIVLVASGSAALLRISRAKGATLAIFIAVISAIPAVIGALVGGAFG